jgi:hypothetical protein
MFEFAVDSLMTPFIAAFATMRIADALRLDGERPVIAVREGRQAYSIASTGSQSDASCA